MFAIIIAWVEKHFPGAAAIIQAAEAKLTREQVLEAVLLALKDYQAGQNFLQILEDVLKSFQAPPAA